MSISSYTFRGCTALTSIIIPQNVVTIATDAFKNCTGLHTVTFNGTPTKIVASAFSNDTAITDIYVPWAEGVVANAPWGATNATIHYNS